MTAARRRRGYPVVSGAELIRRRVAGLCIRCGHPYPMPGLDTLPNLLCTQCAIELAPPVETPGDRRALARDREATLDRWLAKGSE